jgi:hypothetical protein
MLTNRNLNPTNIKQQLTLSRANPVYFSSTEPEIHCIVILPFHSHSSKQLLSNRYLRYGPSHSN